jgi:hypothetical protein
MTRLARVILAVGTTTAWRTAPTGVVEFAVGTATAWRTTFAEDFSHSKSSDIDLNVFSPQTKSVASIFVR